MLKEAHHHHAKEILDLTLRGEYLYTANGPDGFEVFDVANIDNNIDALLIVAFLALPVAALIWRLNLKDRARQSENQSWRVWQLALVAGLLVFVGVVKHFWRTPVPEPPGLVQVRVRRFGETTLTFLTRMVTDASERLP